MERVVMAGSDGMRYEMPIIDVIGCDEQQDPRFIYVGRVLLRTYYKVVNLQRSKLNLQRSKLNLQRSKRSKLTDSAVS